MIYSKGFPEHLPSLWQHDKIFGYQATTGSVCTVFVVPPAPRFPQKIQLMIVVSLVAEGLWIGWPGLWAGPTRKQLFFSLALLWSLAPQPHLSTHTHTPCLMGSQSDAFSTFWTWHTAVSCHTLQGSLSVIIVSWIKTQVIWNDLSKCVFKTIHLTMCLDSLLLVSFSDSIVFTFRLHEHLFVRVLELFLEIQ